MRFALIRTNISGEYPIRNRQLCQPIAFNSAYIHQCNDIYNGDLTELENMNVVVLLLLGLIPAFGYAYEMMITHDPWWAYEDSNSIENSYQFFQPYYKEKPKKNDFGWKYPTTSSIQHKVPKVDWKKVPKVDFSKIPMPKMPSIPSWPNQPRKMSEERRRAMNAREWPDWIPPIRMVKLPLDDPPAF